MEYSQLKYFLVIVLTIKISIASSTLFAQVKTGSVAGILRDSAGTAVDSAVITIENTKYKTISDKNGNFTLENIPAGTYTLTIYAEKYGLRKINIKTEAGKKNTLDITLKEEVAELNEIVVIGKSTTEHLKEGEFSANSIDAKQYMNGTADVNQVLNRSTGVRIRENGGLGSDFNFSLNGLSGRSIKFFIDGVPMETFGSSMSLNNFPVNLIDRMEVYKGVVPVSLGSDALGGAVNIVTNQKVKKYLDASYSYGSFNTHRAALSGLYKHDRSGFTVKANVFYNYSDNNYLMRNNPEAGVVIQVVENGQFVQKDVRRFHDTYQSAMGQMEVGFANKKWADLFFLGLIGSQAYKELQTGRNVEAVIGKANTHTNFLMPTLKYKKTDLILKGLQANLFASYSQDKTLLTDTSSNLYSWSGQPRVVGNMGGELDDSKSLYHYKLSSLVNRTNLSYKINEVHSLDMNYTLTNAQRTAYNKLNPTDILNLYNIPARLTKQITGIAYQSNLFHSRLTTTLFGKYYNYKASSQEVVHNYTTNWYDKLPVKTLHKYYGYGIASRVKIVEAFGIKASYEHAYRLPEDIELFGDGLFILPNPQIQPEASDNVNLGLYFFKRWQKHKLSLESGLFYRNTKNFINLMPVGAGKKSEYLNIDSVIVKGIEAELKYEYNNLLLIALNIADQSAIDNTKYVTTDAITVTNNTYKNRIPNQPWLYGNAELGLGKNNLLGKGTRLQFTWFTQYVHWFYLSWEAFGSPQSHSTIPNQLLHTASLTYSMKEGRYNISFECRNLTNALAYDNFRLQKPGRAFYIKLRYFLK